MMPLSVSFFNKKNGGACAPFPPCSLLFVLSFLFFFLATKKRKRTAASFFSPSSSSSAARFRSCFFDFPPFFLFVFVFYDAREKSAAP